MPVDPNCEQLTDEQVDVLLVDIADELEKCADAESATVDQKKK